MEPLEFAMGSTGGRSFLKFSFGLIFFQKNWARFDFITLFCVPV